MRMKSRLFIPILAFILVIVQCLDLTVVAAAPAGSESVSVTKEVNPIEIFEGGESEVTINVQGTPDSTFVKPNDIILIIDRSGSMGPNYGPNNGEDKMRNAKEAAKGFIDLVDFSKHRVGVVDFASNVSYTDLSSDPTQLKQYVDGIRASGGTATKSAIEKAQDLLRNHRSDAQPVIILMTDGQATEPAPDSYAREVALEQANLAKSEGVVFYTIALLLPNENPQTSGPNLLMKEMATTAHHHHFVLGSVGLAEIYSAIVQEIGIASAYDVVVTDFISPQFEIVPGSYNDNIPQPTVNGNTISWSFLELKNELLTFNYKIRHKVGEPVGTFPAGDEEISVRYKDFLGQSHSYTVPQPTLTVKHFAPVITSIEPNVGHVDGGDSILISGEHFRPNATVHFGETQVSNIEYINSGQLRVIAPPGVQGPVVVKVTNEDGQFTEGQYRYYAEPIIEELSPTEGPIEGGTTVTIRGNYFLPDVIVTFGGTDATVTKASSTELLVISPAGTSPETVDVVITNSDGTSITEKDAFTYIEGPSITSIEPNVGNRTGGEAAKLIGERFIDGVRVYFNNILVDSTFISATEVAINTPVWPRAESVDVVVENPNGQKYVLQKGYTYEDPEPIITSVSPNSGPLAGGTTVTVRGDYFHAGTTLLWDGNEITNITYVNSKEIRLRTPAAISPGKVSLKIINPDSKAAEQNDVFEYLAPPDPKLISISPTSGLISGGTTVTLEGEHIPANINVFFNDIEVPVKSVNATQIVVVTPEWLEPEKVDVRIQTATGFSETLYEAFEYLPLPKPPAPTISGVSPNSGLISGNTTITINGSGFQDGLQLTFNEQQISYTFVHQGMLRVRTPAWDKPELVTISITNPDGQSVSLPDAFEYLPLPAPTITSVTPDKGPVSGGTSVKILGTNFKSSSKVYFNDIELRASLISAGELRIITPVWTESETVDVSVVNDDGQSAVLESAFTFEVPPPPPAPTITSVSPNHGPMTGRTVVTITGGNFTSDTKVDFGGVIVTGTLLSASEIRINTPARDVAETVDVTVFDSVGQQAVLENAFTYDAPPEKPNPVVTSVSPDSAELPGVVTVTVNGENFEVGAKVFFGSVELGTTYLSANQLRVRTPAWDVAESVDVKVVNPDGKEGVLENGFTYMTPPPPPAPLVTSASPNTAVATVSTTILINGDNFERGAKVAFNDVEMATSFINSNQLRVNTPIWGQADTVTLRVINPDGQVGELAEGFVFIPDVPPTVTSVSPNSSLLSGGGTVTISGTNFKPGSKVLFDTQEIAVTYVNSSSLRIRVPVWSTPGPVDVVVINPDGQSGTLQAGFTYNAPAPKPAPIVTSASPNTGSRSGGNTILINGANIQSGAVVEVNGVRAAATYLSSTQLRVRVPASSITGAVDITVINPDGQSGTLTGGYTYY